MVKQDGHSTAPSALRAGRFHKRSVGGWRQSGGRGGAVVDVVRQPTHGFLARNGRSGGDQTVDNCCMGGQVPVRSRFKLLVN